jgi:tetratricopeptide (TPR) repeat protein
MIAIAQTLAIALAFAAETPEAPFRPAYLDPKALDLTGLSERYQACVGLIIEDAGLGRRGAAQWANEGGGPPALHCLAIGDLAAGFPKLAAIRLVELADRTDAGDPAVRARIAAEATLAWLDASDTASAGEALATAKKLAPGDPSLFVIEALVHEAAGKLSAAAEAVTAAEKAGVRTANAYLIRARARRAQGDHLAAAEDVAAALNLEPLNIDALTMRGDLAAAGVTIEAY